MKRVSVCLLATGCLMWMLGGCISVKAPESIEVGGGRPEPVRSDRIPNTKSHEDCREELYRAYQNIQYLEQENRRLSEKAARYKQERDRYKDRLEAIKERNDD